MVAAREAFDLDLERGTVARTETQPRTRLELRHLVHVRRDDLVRARIGVCHVTQHLRGHQVRSPVQVRERTRRLFTVLHGQARVVDRAAIEARWCACE
jgi:hypothetical protein